MQRTHIPGLYKQTEIYDNPQLYARVQNYMTFRERYDNAGLLQKWKRPKKSSGQFRAGEVRYKNISL